MGKSANDVRAVSPGASRREFLRISGLVGLAAGGSWSLSGCGLFGAEDPEVGAAGGKLLRISYVPVDVLDPQVITNGMWIMSRGILEGLVVQNETGDDVVPAVAESWTVSDDDLTYTFQLRANAAWSNGDPVTADDFERTYKRLLTPSGTSAGGTTLGANAYQVSTGIKGASDFLAGATDDWRSVGVTASDERELVLTLDNPNPDLLLALTHPALLPLHMDSVDAKPDDWGEPPNFISNGPYAVTKWEKNSSLQMVPNKHYWDGKYVSLDRIEVQLVEPTTSGTASVPYENNEVDILQITDADVVRFQKDPELSTHLKSVETYSIAYLAKLRSEHPALEDVRVRKALSLALGRDTLKDVVPGAQPGLSLVTERTEGWDESIAVQEDVDEAKQLLADAGYPNGKGLPEIRILTGVTSPLVDAITDIWKQNLGIKVRPDVVEAGVYTERRWQLQKGDYIGFYFGTFAGLPTWPTMVGTLWSPLDIQKFSLSGKMWDRFQKIELDEEMDPAAKTDELNRILGAETSPGSREMTELVNEAFSEPDEERRLQLFKDAAKIREEEYLFIPVLWLSVFFAVRPTIQNLRLRPYPDFFYLKSVDLKA